MGTKETMAETIDCNGEGDNVSGDSWSNVTDRPLGRKMHVSTIVLVVTAVLLGVRMFS